MKRDADGKFRELFDQEQRIPVRVIAKVPMEELMAMLATRAMFAKHVGAAFEAGEITADQRSHLIELNLAHGR